MGYRQQDLRCRKSEWGQIRPFGDSSAAPVSLSRSDFRFDPETEEFETLSWGASRWGNGFDDAYTRFVCQNTAPARHIVLPRKYLARSKYLRIRSVFQSLAKERGSEPVYRSSPPEAWRVVRANRRQARGKPANPGEINATGYFTASCGITIYRGDALPDTLKGNIFVGDAAENIVHRRILEPDGVTFDSKRADENTEFIASSDNFFRPVNFANAPDGTLHVVDMYREIIEGSQHIPQDLKEKGLVDIYGGSDCGRVYRVAPPGFEFLSQPKLGGADVPELVEHLENGSSWWRETAQRLLIERKDKGAIDPLRKMLAGGSTPTARLHALWTLDGLGELGDEELTGALSDRSSVVREHAVRVAESRLGLDTSARLREKIFQLRDDEALRVRFQVAFTLGEVDDEQATRALAKIAVKDRDDPWMRIAVLSSSHNRMDQLFSALLAEPSYATEDSGIEMMQEIAFILASRKKRVEMNGALFSIAELEPSDRSLELQIRLLSRFLRAGRHELVHSSIGEKIGIILPQARRLALDEAVEASVRADAVTFFAFHDMEAARPILLSLIGTRHPYEVQVAAIQTLARTADEKIAALLIEKWGDMTPQVRNEVVETLASRRKWTIRLLEAVGEKRISSSEISAARREKLSKHPDQEIREEASKLLRGSSLGKRDDVIRAYQPALAMAGDAERGEAVFLANCTACHRFGAQGNEIGPNLSDYGRKRLPPEMLMTQILDPNRDLSPEFVNYIVTRNDGAIVSGFITSETPGSITLKQVTNATVSILRKDISEIKSTGMSLMPEGLENNIDHQQMADLLQFLLKISEKI